MLKEKFGYDRAPCARTSTDADLASDNFIDRFFHLERISIIVIAMIAPTSPSPKPSAAALLPTVSLFLGAHLAVTPSAAGGGNLRSTKEKVRHICMTSC